MGTNRNKIDFSVAHVEDLPPRVSVKVVFEKDSYPSV